MKILLLERAYLLQYDHCPSFFSNWWFDHGPHNSCSIPLRIGRKNKLESGKSILTYSHGFDVKTMVSQGTWLSWSLKPLCERDPRWHDFGPDPEKREILSRKASENFGHHSTCHDLFFAEGESSRHSHLSFQCEISSHRTTQSIVIANSQPLLCTCFCRNACITQAYTGRITSTPHRLKANTLYKIAAWHINDGRAKCSADAGNS